MVETDAAPLALTNNTANTGTPSPSAVRPAAAPPVEIAEGRPHRVPLYNGSPMGREVT